MSFPSAAPSRLQAGKGNEDIVFDALDLCKQALHNVYYYFK